MIAVVFEEMHGSDRDARPGIDWRRAPMVGMAKLFHESEMALSSECGEQCAQKALDNAGIVRDAMSPVLDDILDLCDVLFCSAFGIIALDNVVNFIQLASQGCVFRFEFADAVLLIRQLRLRKCRLRVGLNCLAVVLECYAAVPATRT